MTYSSSTINHLVIQGYLNGKSRDKISKEIGISTGKISNVIKEWKRRIDIPNVEELRDFATEVKKSGIFIGQCSQGYRMLQLMHNLGVADDGDREVDNIRDYNGGGGGKSNGGGGKSNGGGGNVNHVEFSTFVKDIYLNCKNFGIKPAIIFSWIKDLFSCYSSPLNNPSSFIDGQQQQQQKIEGIAGDDKKPGTTESASSDPKILSSTFHGEATEFELRADSKNLDDTITTINNPNSEMIINKNTAPVVNPPKKSASLTQIEAPYISQLSNHIAQKKKECMELVNYNKALEKETRIRESKRKQIEFEFDLIKQEEKYVMPYIDWFYDLKKELWERYSMKIEDFENFTSVINAFKKNGFDAPKIMEKYISAISLDDKIKKEDDEIKILYGQKVELNKDLSYLQEQTN
ncbi:MAG: hypothetical protein ABJB76_01700 [Candidatus Nitrosocosmicus sp.]